MYLKAMWLIKENKELIKISTIANLLGIRQSSVVQMLQRIDKMGYVNYRKWDITMTDKGEQIGQTV